ncbi:MAG: SPOR domain-containing protein [Alloprevotella sp.]
MIELSRHIEALLLTHDLVIVPGLGGFVARRAPARYVADESLFLPPLRTIGFNPALTFNDGLLVQSYMAVYESTYPDTLRMIEEAVDELKNKVLAGEEVLLHGIGTLSASLDGPLRFSPCEAGAVSPSLYGLGSFVAETIGGTTHRQHRRRQVARRRLRTAARRTRQAWHAASGYVTAAVVALLFYFAWAQPLATDQAGGQSLGAAINPTGLPAPHNNINEKIAKPAVAASKTKAEAPQLLPVEASKEAAKPAEKPSEHKANPASSKTEAQGRYTLVLVSQVPMSKAEAYAAEMREEGLTEANAFAKGKMVRVIYGRYADEAEARSQLNQLKRHSERFADAWVLAL